MIEILYIPLAACIGLIGLDCFGFRRAANAVALAIIVSASLFAIALFIADMLPS